MFFTNRNIGAVRPDVDGVLVGGQLVDVLLLGEVARPDDQLEVVLLVFTLVDPRQPLARLLLKVAPEVDES